MDTHLSDMGIYAGLLALFCIFLVVMLTLKKQSAKALQIGLTAGLIGIFMLNYASGMTQSSSVDEMDQQYLNWYNKDILIDDIKVFNYIDDYNQSNKSDRNNFNTFSEILLKKYDLSVRLIPFHQCFHLENMPLLIIRTVWSVIMVIQHQICQALMQSSQLQVVNIFLFWCT